MHCKMQREERYDEDYERILVKKTIHRFIDNRTMDFIKTTTTVKQQH